MLNDEKLFEFCMGDRTNVKGCDFNSDFTTSLDDSTCRVYLCSFIKNGNSVTVLLERSRVLSIPSGNISYRIKFLPFNNSQQQQQSQLRTLTPVNVWHPFTPAM